MKTELLHTIDELSYEYELVELFDILSEKGSIVFFGGFPRDKLLYDYQTKKIRDLDIVFIPDKSKELDLSKVFTSIGMNYKKNRYDGFKLIKSDLKVDIWDIKNTWAFRTCEKQSSFDNLVKTTYSSFDSVAFNYTTGKLLDKGLKQTVRKQTIDLVMQDNPDVELNLLKNLIQLKKYQLETKQQLEFSPSMKHEFVTYYQSTCSLENLYFRQQMRYEEEYYTLSELKKVFKSFE